MPCASPPIIYSATAALKKDSITIRNRESVHQLGFSMKSMRAMFDCLGRFWGIFRRDPSVPKVQPVTSCNLSVFLHQFGVYSSLGCYQMMTSLANWCARFLARFKELWIKGRFTLRWRRPPVGQECLAKTWLYEANGGCAGEELKAIKYFYWVGLLQRRS
jgi:hypothetical protein